MTNHKLAKSGGRRPPNKKDPQPPRQTKAQRLATGDRWEAAGFTQTDWNKWEYGWSGEFPTFNLAPGIVADGIGTRAGLVAIFLDVKILFPYGTPPDAIAAQLDNEIKAIIGLHADVADPVALDYIPFLGEPMIVDGQEIGPEVAF